jgi:hypothetical protein
VRLLARDRLPTAPRVCRVIWQCGRMKPDSRLHDCPLFRAEADSGRVQFESGYAALSAPRRRLNLMESVGGQVETGNKHRTLHAGARDLMKPPLAIRSAMCLARDHVLPATAALGRPLVRSNRRIRQRLWRRFTSCCRRWAALCGCLKKRIAIQFVPGYGNSNPNYLSGCSRTLWIRKMPTTTW